MAIVVIVLWILLTGGFIGVGVVYTNLAMVMIGFFSLFGFIIIGEVCRANNPKNKKHYMKMRQREKQIEEEYGVIDFFDKKD